jgi:hypothetical protein
MSAEKIPVLGAILSEEPELTPAASEALDQNVENIRLQILREIARVYRDPGHRVRTADVESAMNSVTAFDAPSRFGASLKTMLAIFLAVVTLVVELVTQISKSSETWFTTAVALMVGVTTGTGLVIVVQETRRRRRRSHASLHEFLRTFGAMEDAVRDHARELLGGIADNASLGRAISAIELMQLWTPEDSQIFRRLLAVRNAVVHEESRDLPVREVAAGFSQMARLTSLLESASVTGTRSKLADFTESRAALVFEERVAHALRRAAVSVATVQSDSGYDLLIERSDIVRKVIIKYRKSGLLAVHDIADVVEKVKPGIATTIVTNAAVSPYVNEYLELSRDDGGDTKQISIVSWRDQADKERLVYAIMAVAADVE